MHFHIVFATVKNVTTYKFVKEFLLSSFIDQNIQNIDTLRQIIAKYFCIKNNNVLCLRY